MTVFIDRRTAASCVEMDPLSKRFETAVLFQNGSIGDFLMSIFLAEMLKKSGYVEHITIIVPRNLNFLKGLIGSYPYISGVEISRHGGWVRLLKIIHGPCLVVLQPALGLIPLRIKVLAWLLSRGYRSALVGFQDKSRLCKAFYSKTLVYDTNRLFSENIQNVMSVLGAPVNIDVPALNVIPAKEIIHSFGLAYTPYALFHPGASAPRRSFTVRAAREVIEHVLKQNSEMHVVLSGSAAERNYLEEIKMAVQKQERVHTAIGRSAQEMAALIQFAQCFIGTDTGITHLACFLRARVIVAAHPGSAANWLPFYCPTATVLYCLEDQDRVHQERDYLETRRRGKLRPFGMVPVNAICGVLDELLNSRANDASDQVSCDKMRAWIKYENTLG